MRRREFIGLLGFAAAWPVTSRAEQDRLHRIGFMGNSTASLEANLVEPFRQKLGELGYVEGRDILIEYRWAEGDYDRFPGLVRELIASGA